MRGVARSSISAENMQRGRRSAFVAVCAACWIGTLAAGNEDTRSRFLAPQERGAFLARVEASMSGVRSITADFRQEKSLKLFKDTVRSSGVILFSRPDKLRWEILEPFHSILVVSGDEVGKFEYVGGTRRPLKLGGGKEAILIVMERIRSWFLGKFDSEGRYYEIDATTAPVPLIVLRPKEEALRKNIQAIELELSADLAAVSKVTIRGGDGDTTVLRFTERRRDAKFPRDTFSVRDPVPLPAEPPESERSPSGAAGAR